MCPYEKDPGCLNCPFPDCMLNGDGNLPRRLQPARSHHAEGSKEKEREYNLKYKAKHREAIRKRDREKYRRMRNALAYCERHGIDFEKEEESGRPESKG